MKVAVLGGGSWGTSLARHIALLGHSVTIWCHEPSVAEGINTQHRNPFYLSTIDLPPNLVATNDMQRALYEAEFVMQVSPSHVVRNIMTEAAPFLPQGVPILNASKGIENDSLMTISEVLEECLPIPCHPYLAYLGGPSFALEVAQQQPSAVVVASHSFRIARQIQQWLNTTAMRVYTSIDVIGVELGGALKNVIAIAAGAADGMGLGMNSRAGMITRGLSEISRLAVRKGANPLTLAGLSGMGDLILTCYGELSRNRTVGYRLGQGTRLDAILADMKMVAEGVRTARSAKELGESVGVELPIIEQVYQVLYHDKPVREAVYDLMTRELKRELEP